MTNKHDLAHLIHNQAQKYDQKTALNFREIDANEWTSISWTKFSNRVKVLSRALFDLDIQVGDRIVQFSFNKAENLIVDFAAYAIRAVVVPVYPTYTADELTHIVQNAGGSIIFVGNEEQYQKTLIVDASVAFRQIVVIENSVQLQGDKSLYFDDFLLKGKSSTSAQLVDERSEGLVEDDLACILYTSGTSGESKGVKISHANLNEALRVHAIKLDFVRDCDTSVAFLPFTHIFERMWSYFCLYRGVEIFINENPTDIMRTIWSVKPNYMCAVPRFVEKLYARITEEIANMAAIKQGIASWAMAIGEQYNLGFKRIGKIPDATLELKYYIANKLVFSPMKRKMGFDNMKMMPVAGARLPDELIQFCKCLDIPVVYGYGLTESTATVACFDEIGYKIGSVGTVIPDLNVKIAPDSEVLLKGKTITPGYYNNPTADEEAFTKDGWFKTGDSGYLKANHLFLTDRIKDLYKTSNGKFISPQKLESLLTLDKYIEQVAVIGDNRNYVTALIVPDMKALKEYAVKHHIDFDNPIELIDSPQINDMIRARIDEIQKNMVAYEHIKKFKLVPSSFSIDTGELTNTLKVRRVVIMHKYKSLIDQMYDS